METKIISNILRVYKGSFTADNKKIDYCKLYIVDDVKNETDDVGLVVNSISTDVDNFELLKNLYAQKKNVEITIEFVPSSDGKYKRKATKFVVIEK